MLLLPVVWQTSSLTFDISIYFFIYIFYTTGISVGKIMVGARSPLSSSGYWQIRRSSMDTHIAWICFYFTIHWDRAWLQVIREGIWCNFEGSSPISWKRIKYHNADLIHSPSLSWKWLTPHSPTAATSQDALNPRYPHWNVQYPGHPGIWTSPGHPGHASQ